MKHHPMAKGLERESVEVDVEEFRIPPGERVRLARRQTRIAPPTMST